MIILDSKKAGRRYKIKQFIKYTLLSIFSVAAFFLLGVVIYDINSSTNIDSYEETYVNVSEQETPRNIEELIEEISVEDIEINTPHKNTSQEIIPSETIDDLSITEEELKNSEGGKLFYQKLAEIEAATKVSEKKALPSFEEKDETTELSQDKLDEIYEEKLPEDIILDELEEEDLTPEQQAAGYHIYQRHADVKKLNIIPKYKPAYFGEEPVIAIVIDDMGISKKRTADIISLQAPLTASFLTYGTDLSNQVKAAQNAGMEIMLHAPMEPYSKKDIAPDVLTTEMTVEEVKSGLKKMLEKFSDIKGINNHMGSKFTEDEERMKAVMSVLQEEGLFFLDSKTTSKSVGKKVAKEYGVSYATRHVFIDNENKVEYILNQLKTAEKVAKRNGYAVAIGHPKSGTYEALRQWLPSLKEKKIKILHMSDIVKVLHKSHI